MTKRSIFFALLAASLLTAPACGKKKAPAAPSAPPPSAPVETAPTPVPPPPANVTVSPPPPAAPARLTASDVEDIQKNVFVRIHFAFDQHFLTPEAVSTLENHAAWLKAHPTVKLVIEGHCDERGTANYNLALGERRAHAAREYLLNLGVAAPRLSTISYGRERPLDARHVEEGWAANRRDEFIIVEY